jgi:hypothetical protein
MSDIVVRPMTDEDLERMMIQEQLDRSEHELTEDDLAPLHRYVQNRIEPGDFLMAVLCNDLKEACGRADSRNRRRIFEYVSWLWNEAPSTCWGSPAKVAAWLSRGDAA